MSEGKIKRQLPTCLKGYIDPDDGDYWKVLGNIETVLDEAKHDILADIFTYSDAEALSILTKRIYKWFGTPSPTK